MATRLLQFAALLGWATVISGQALVATLKTHSELSQFNSYVESFLTLSGTLSNITNYTILAPSNTAITTWLNTTSPTQAEIEATLEYHILHGQWAQASASSTPQFPISYLSNSSFANVTGGVAVEFLEINGASAIQSAVKATSLIIQGDLVADGGLFHIIDRVLSIPLQESPTASEANMTYYTDIIAKAGYLSGESNSIGNKLVIQPDMTFFIPNTAAAETSFMNITSGWDTDQLNALLVYHAVQGVVVYSTTMINGTLYPTVQGGNITISVAGTGSKYVNDVRILETDYLTSNGVMHTIDGVLNPYNITTFTNSTTLPSSSSDDDLSTGAIVGIAIGSAFAVLTALLGILCYRRRSKRKSAKKVVYDTPVEQFDSFERTSFHEPEHVSTAIHEMGADKPVVKELDGESSTAGRHELIKITRAFNTRGKASVI